MRSVNKVTLVGIVDADPQVETGEAVEKVAFLSLATTRRIERESGSELRTAWHRLTLTGKQADLAEEYIRKGDRLYVEGRIEYGSIEQHDLVLPTTEIVVEQLMLWAPCSLPSVTESMWAGASARTREFFGRGGVEPVPTHFTKRAMARTPKWKVYDAGGDYQASCKEPEAAAVLVSFYGVGSTIRWDHGKPLWTEGVDGSAGESYDHVAELLLSRL